ncbi:hypothetical protein AG37_10420 [Salmonella enterica subsp. enterica]|uniref:hypothetical protein n=1 Tax=Salmonella enterica TaxID=28901 RepID=UPI0009AF123D|nr:hypothetical protein [Salmonella enterica]ECI4635298.1 hypothetical protein [Salmonella enterica subsp. enterica]EAZ8556529.1 hypothetical protein [Salmonella enterica]EBQ7783267.1 hypothetical protein [Salmonella enterica]EBR4746329.1 hypothetical protein [Salmonella enterica]EJH0548882.1 hypothetical protein [Salmonella enterica]
MSKDLFSKFPTYPVDQLSGIFINGISPESMTHDFEAKHVKHKVIKANLRDPENGQVFCISTQTKKPMFRYRVGQEVDISNPYNFNHYGSEKRGVVVGTLTYYLKGFSFTGYMLEYIE